MDVQRATDVTRNTIETFPYRGKDLEVRGVDVRWLSQAGEEGAPDYGLRLFTIEPDGKIPIHKHFYHQTMYILTGQFECWSFDAETDELVTKVLVGPGEFVYVPSMEPHGMKNASGTEDGTFLCCICNVYED